MRQNELLDALRARPFRPLRIHVSDGTVYEVRHPELVRLTRSSALICTALAGQPPELIDRFNLVDLLHITQIEYADSARPAGTE